VPKDLRADYYVNTRRARIVEIRDLGQAALRVRPLTDAELADAILAVAQTPHPRGRGQLLSDLRHQRGCPAPDVSKVYRWHQSGLSKPILADALWPVLERKIQTALDRGKPGPPVLRACIRAYEMAAVSGKDVHHAEATAVEAPEITLEPRADQRAWPVGKAVKPNCSKLHAPAE
jgi:hypothetical protein